MLLVFCFALQAEAVPFIKEGKCKIIYQQKDLKYYKGKDYACLVSGIGRIRMATAIGWINAFENEKKFLVNIGIAGSVKEELYSWHLIAKVQDELSGKYFYPEISLYDNLPLKHLLSVNFPSNNAYLKNIKANLVDMEGYSFCKAAQTFLPSSQFQLIKFVSDNGSDYFHFENWIEPYLKNVRNITETALIIKTKIEHTSNCYQTGFEEWLEKIDIKLKPTFSQKIQLRNAIIFALNTKGTDFLNHCIESLPMNLKQKEQKSLNINKLIDLMQHV